MGKRSKIVIGSRGSQLALLQTNLVAQNLKDLVSCEICIKRIKTRGDKILDSPLAKIGGKGLFVKEIELALERGEIDLAVHSMKDVPTDIPLGLSIAAILQRDDPRDVLISRDNIPLRDLPRKAVIATSSLRRKAQLLHFRPDIKLVDIRGNLDTRLKKLESGQFDAIIVAAAGIDRMGWSERVTERIPTEICLSAVGQGAIGIEARIDDQEMIELARQLNHHETWISISAERALMKRLGGGCQVPIAALGKVQNNELRLTALVASLDGSKLVKDNIIGDPYRAQYLGILLAARLLERGADQILKEIRHLSERVNSKFKTQNAK